ncbi:MAG: beta-galactosidase [Acidobacteriaceae bacterium]
MAALTSGIRHCVLITAFLAAGLPLCAQQTPQVHSFTVDHTNFLLDGAPFQIVSGEMHYARIPRAYWRDRLRKAKAMGLNTISTYVFWNVHETKPGVFDFSGDKDVAGFVRMAQEEGLYVILRPGPYSCAEWDLGGYPAWLLADPHMLLRSTQPQFMQAATRWMMRLGQELAPLQIQSGGPIIAVQVENEYGSFGQDKQYLEAIRELLVKSGFDRVLLYTADGPQQLPKGTLPGVQAVVNFGPGEAQKAFTSLARFRPNEPLMSGEYWDGWFDHWAHKHETTDARQQARELDWMLSKGYSVNLYMVHGGTSFGFMSGANWDGGYLPDTTSYDYDAPLDEAGVPTAKYFVFRDVILKRTHANPRALPFATPVIAIPEIKLEQSAPLWSNLPKPVSSDEVLPMEAVGESYGYILYRTQLTGSKPGPEQGPKPGPEQGTLVLHQLHDYCRIFVNGKLAGTLDRRLKQDRLTLDLGTGNNTIDILVENSGRVNYTDVLRGERQGITHSVTFAGEALKGWQMYPLSMQPLIDLDFKKKTADGPAFYRGTFRLAKTGDTFLDTKGLGKGAIWVNGHAVGRFWNIGPQRTLYLPGAWLKAGRNELVVFSLDPLAKPTLRAIDHPILDDMHMMAEGR